VRPRRLRILTLGGSVAISVAILFLLGRPATQTGDGVVIDSNKSLAIANGGIGSNSTHPNTLERRNGKLALSFEPNRGQTDARVKFVSRGRGYTLFLTPTEVVLALRKAGATATRHPIDAPASRTDAEEAYATSATVLSIELMGANPAPQVTGQQELPGKSNHFIGNDPRKWRTNVPTYARVNYRDVYPGVDLIHYGNPQRLEHDFVVRPGANPKVITLGFPRADRVTLDAQGNLLIDIGTEKVILQAPVIYQESQGDKQSVEGRYLLKGPQQVGFEVAAYDTRKPLVIDPVLVYSTYLGGSNADDQGNGIAVDSTGNTYVVGQTASTNFPTAGHPPQSTYGGGIKNIFVSKLNASGTALVYSTYLGGTGDDEGIGIAVDSSGNAYVTGQAGSTNFPTTANAVQRAYGGGSADAFVSKLSADGSTLVYSTYLGGNDFDIGLAITPDSSGNAYITGQTRSGNFPMAGIPVQGSNGGTSDIYVSKLNATGTALVYSTYLGGGGDEKAYSITVDSSGNAYIAGETSSINYPTAGNPLQRTFGGGATDAIVSKLNATGSALVYSTYLGGSGDEHAHGIAVDSSGNAYIGGFTTSTNFPTTASAFQRNFAGGATNGDAFVSKLNATGTALVYSTYLGGSGDEYCHGLAIDSSGNAYIVGYTKSTDFPTAGGPLQNVSGGSSDVYLSELSADGSALVYSSYLGGAGDDEGNSLAVDSAGNAYITGFTNSPNFPTAGNRLQPTLAGGFDAFVAKFSFGNPFSFVQAKASGTSFGAGTTTFDSPNTPGNTIVVGLDYGDTSTGSITSVTDTAGNTYTRSCAGVKNVSQGYLEVWHAPNIAAAARNAVTVTPNGGFGLQYAIAEYAGPPVSGPMVDACGAAAGAGTGPDVMDSGPVSTSNKDLIIGWGRTSGGTASPGTNFTAAMAGVDGQLLEHRLGVASGSVKATESNSVAAHWTMIVVGFLPRSSGAPSTAPVVRLSGSNLTFASQQLNTTGAAQTVTLTNTGNAALSITSIGVTGVNSGDYAQTNTCGSSVAANNGSCTISVTFTPTATGTRTGALTITDSATGSPHSVSLNGTGSSTPSSVIVTPTSQDFGSQAVGSTSRAAIVNFKYVGTTYLTIKSITVTGDFTLTNYCGSGLSPGYGCEVWVRFNPTAPGLRTGTLIFTDSAPDSPQVTSLTGLGTSSTAPVVGLSAPSLTFASQQLNTTSAAQTVTLTNTGNAALNITGVAVTGANSGDYAQTNTCGASLATNANCTISATFTPTATGTRTAAVTISDNAAGGPHSISLTGTGAAAPTPVVSLSAPSLTFASQQLNTTSAAQTVTLTNTGNAALNITGVTVTGANSGDYAQTNTCGASLAANANCTISVTFIPTATGTRTAAVTISDNAAGSPHGISLTGTGAAASAPVVSLSAPSLTFASQQLNTSSAAQTVTLTNTGNAALSITSIGVSGVNSGDYAQTNTCGSSVAANNGSCTISVTFTPTATGTRTAAVTISDNAAGSPHSISLTGTGAAAPAPVVGLSAPSLTFASQQLNTTSAAQTVTLTNTGNAALSITSIGVTGVNSGDYAQTNTCGSSVAANNGSCTISVTFTPTATGTRTGALTITDSASGSPHSVSLNGTGSSTPSSVMLTPTSHDFGSQAVGSTSRATIVSFKYVGTTYLTIKSITVTGDFTLTNYCGSGLSPGYGCDVWVRFNPTAPGLRAGTLIFTDSAPDSPHSISLTGIGQ
jgi:hypothetical protein